MDDRDPLSVIDRLRTTEMLPKQYRNGIYDNSKQNLKQFVLVLNDYNEEARFVQIRDIVATQFGLDIIHEIRMSAPKASSGASTTPSN